MNRSKQHISQLLRIARVIEQRYAVSSASYDLVPLPALLEALACLERRLQLARQRGWYAACNRLKQDYVDQLYLLQTEISDVIRGNKAESPGYVAGLGDILRDLMTLQQEFDDLSFVEKTGRLSVVTESIELEGIYLGPFKISLKIKTLSRVEKGCYDVIALEPHPANSDPEVTHPHVQSQLLCEGEARQPIRRALREGRLLDFFQLVNNVLQTYNSHGPYCSLDDWEGQSCDDCGRLTSSNNYFCCEACECRVCDECERNCTECNNSYCANCSKVCNGCDSDLCKDCVKKCITCNQDLCPGCLTNERCFNCGEQIENDEEQDAATDADSDAAVHTAGLGQAAVSA